jgi:hypothetical protein
VKINKGRQKMKGNLKFYVQKMKNKVKKDLCGIIFGVLREGEKISSKRGGGNMVF